ncbi:hypothetical protein AB0K09_08785 [Streptomyces sp. NPDC049577]|uniref:hypothetical protein n=1 Tax=Streptomyces sp. NPDC049577 TaxID=3155153 RepID=UPI0034371114
MTVTIDRTTADERAPGRITRVTVNPALRPVIPRKGPVTGDTVHPGRFTGEQDPHKLLPQPAGKTVGRQA